MTDPDFKAISELLVQKGKVRGKPVAISLFHDAPPQGYEAVQECPCTIVHHAMDNGRKTYFDAEHHDCIVGVYHAGMVQEAPQVQSGTYLSQPSSFFSYEGAAKLKASTPNLPLGLVQAIGAAPLDEVPDGVAVNWVVVAANPHHANFIACGRMCQEGVEPFASFGNTVCVDFFARPWFDNNNLVVSGDFGGRMHTRINQDEVFVVLPTDYLHYLPIMLDHPRIDVKASRRMMKPPHSPFWEQEASQGKSEGPDAALTGLDAARAAAADATGGVTSMQRIPVVEVEEAVTRNPLTEEKPVEETRGQFGAITVGETTVPFSMPWDDDVKEVFHSVPENILGMVVGNSEDWARETDRTAVSRDSIDEQLADMGVTLEELLAMDF